MNFADFFSSECQPSLQLFLIDLDFLFWTSPVSSMHHCSHYCPLYIAVRSPSSSSMWHRFHSSLCACTHRSLYTSGVCVYAIATTTAFHHVRTPAQVVKHQPNSLPSYRSATTHNTIWHGVEFVSAFVRVRVRLRVDGNGVFAFFRAFLSRLIRGKLSADRAATINYSRSVVLASLFVVSARSFVNETKTPRDFFLAVCRASGESVRNDGCRQELATLRLTFVSFSGAWSWRCSSGAFDRDGPSICCDWGGQEWIVTSPPVPRSAVNKIQPRKVFDSVPCAPARVLECVTNRPVPGQEVPWFAGGYWEASNPSGPRVGFRAECVHDPVAGQILETRNSFENAFPAAVKHVIPPTT